LVDGLLKDFDFRSTIQYYVKDWNRSEVEILHTGVRR